VVEAAARRSDGGTTVGGAMTEDGSAELVLSSLSDAVLTIVLHNPERRNAWSLAMERRYFDLLEQADVDPAVRAIVLTGHGTSFCPGADVQQLSTLRDPADLAFERRRPQMYPLRIRKPMIAAINGSCAGIGLVQALVCDVRFAARGARFSTSYARRGLPAEYGMSWLLPRLIGVENALDLLLSARTFEADEAQALGLVSRVCEPADVLARAHDYAVDLARNCSPRSLAMIRRQVHGDLSRRLDDSMLQTLALMRDALLSEDFREGVASFSERRPPQFPPLDRDLRVPGDLGY
jgi:enoyl-CoA hydratase/carnithine racemase